MKIILIGFSTTGKSTILKELKNVVSSDVILIDSDEEISKKYDSHIYNLFIQNHDKFDPIQRFKIMSEISTKENLFIEELNFRKDNYIVALGPNVHTRSNWKNYFDTKKPFIIFLKANACSVLDGLKRRETDLVQEFGRHPAFGNWNHGVIREYSIATGDYQLLSDDISLNNISNLMKVNEDYYEQIADYTIEATKLFKWHTDYDHQLKETLFEFIRAKMTS